METYTERLLDPLKGGKSKDATSFATKGLAPKPFRDPPLVNRGKALLFAVEESKEVKRNTHLLPKSPGIAALRGKATQEQVAGSRPIVKLLVPRGSLAELPKDVLCISNCARHSLLLFRR